MVSTKIRKIVHTLSIILSIINKYNWKCLSYMRVLGISSVFLLTACILSFSLTGAVNAQTDQVPLSVETDYPGYSDGTEIIISGEVRE